MAKNVCMIRNALIIGSEFSEEIV